MPSIECFSMLSSLLQNLQFNKVNNYIDLLTTSQYIDFAKITLWI